MPNTKEAAAKWAEFVAGRSEFPVGGKLLAAFGAGTITWLCDCGCNAFDVNVSDESPALRIAQPGGHGSVFEFSFEISAEGLPEKKGSLEFIVFADERGHFAGIEFDCCANSYPVPEQMLISELPYHVHCSATIDA